MRLKRDEGAAGRGLDGFMKPSKISRTNPTMRIKRRTVDSCCTAATVESRMLPIPAVFRGDNRCFRGIRMLSSRTRLC